MLQATKGILTQAVLYGPDFIQPVIDAKKSSISNRFKKHQNSFSLDYRLKEVFQNKENMIDHPTLLQK